MTMCKVYSIWKQQGYDRKAQILFFTDAVSSGIYRHCSVVSSECKYWQSDGQAPLAARKRWYFHNAVTAQRFRPSMAAPLPCPKSSLTLLLFPSTESLQVRIVWWQYWRNSSNDSVYIWHCCMYPPTYIFYMWVYIYQKYVIFSLVIIDYIFENRQTPQTLWGQQMWLQLQNMHSSGLIVMYSACMVLCWIIIEARQKHWQCHKTTVL